MEPVTQRAVANFIPQFRQVGIVTSNFGFGAFGTGGAHNHSHALGYIQSANNRFQPLAIGWVGNFTADAAAWLLFGISTQ